MSGIIGLIGPRSHRASIESIRDASNTHVSFRGTPALWDGERIVIGAYGSSHLSVAEDGASVFACDGRIDGALPGSMLERSTTTGVNLLQHVLRDFGPQRLDSLAGDYAVARFDCIDGLLTLARDAFGLRPLFWARSADVFGFASDPALLLALGLVGGGLDASRVAAYLALEDFGGEQTAFVGVKRVPGGTWLEVDRQLRSNSGRWFHPNRLPIAPAQPDPDSALERAIDASVRSRCGGRRIALALSGGVDSGAVAVALARAGIRADCVTSTFPNCPEVSEEAGAQSLADATGHRWHGAPAPVVYRIEDLERLARLTGTPLSFPVAEPLTLLDAAIRTGAEVYLDGEGGEPLFDAHPVILRDLLRAGRSREVWRTVRGFRQHHKTSARRLLSAVAGPIWPNLARRPPDDRPPWVPGPGVAAKPRYTSDRQRVCESLILRGQLSLPELWERMLSSANIEYASPLLDLRVVQLAMALPPEQRLPISGAKPVLRRVLLGSLSSSRVKMIFTPYYTSYARSLQRSRPELTSHAKLAARQRLVSSEELRHATSAMWALQAMRLAALELWLGMQR